MELPALLSLPRPPKELGKACHGVDRLRVAPPKGLGFAVKRLLKVLRRRPEVELPGVEGSQALEGCQGCWMVRPDRALFSIQGTRV